MKGKKILLITCYLLVIQLITTHKTQAQELTLIPNDIFSEIQKKDSSKGEILIFQDASLNVLVDRNKRINKNNLKGFRIQIYRGSGQDAREQSNLASQRFMEKFPDYNPKHIYFIYETPYFKVRIGDYRTRNEAFEVLYKVKDYFRDAYIVNSKINFPDLSVDKDLNKTNNDGE